MVGMENFFERPEARLIIEKSTNSDNDKRPSYLHDRDRILFSRSFRRLAKKTQLVPALGIKSSDHLRSRLTHSLEVMQIAASIGNYINLQERKEEKVNIHLIEAISLGHDLGHTPYGHVGEEALCDFFKRSIDHGCFPEKNSNIAFRALKNVVSLKNNIYQIIMG